MTNEEIREKIANNYLLIESLLTKDSFVLNSQIVFLANEIEELRSQCHHDYDKNNFCKYCLLEK